MELRSGEHGIAIWRAWNSVWRACNCDLVSMHLLCITRRTCQAEISRACAARQRAGLEECKVWSSLVTTIACTQPRILIAFGA
eukprot:6211804-Pleurochrysis_carterae.AAC.10